MSGRGRQWLALSLVYFVWGGSYLAMRYTVETIPPLLAAAARCFAAGVIVSLLVVVTRGWRVMRVPFRQAGAAAMMGVLLLVSGNALVMVAERSIPSGLAALVMATMPLLVVALRVGSGDRPPAATLVGVALGLAALSMLVHPGSGRMAGIVEVLAAALSLAVGTFVSPRLALPQDSLVATAYELGFATVPLLVMSIAAGELSGFAPPEVSLTSWSGLAYQVVLGTVAAFTAMVWLLKHAPVSTVSTYAYVNPAVAVILGAMTGEPFSWREAIGGTAVLLAVVVVVTTDNGRRVSRDAYGETSA